MKKIMTIACIALSCASLSFAAKKEAKTPVAQPAVVIATQNVKVEKKVVVKKHKRAKKVAETATTAPATK